MEQDSRSAGPGTITDRSGHDSASPGKRAAPQSPTEALQPETPPVPPKGARRKRRQTLSAISGLLSFLLIATVAVVIGFGWGERRLSAPGPLGADKIVYILPGTDLPDIIDMLEREQVIDDPLFLNVVLLLEGSRSKVRAGEYLFKQATSLRAVIDTLVSGRQVLHAITIPEGLTSEQIMERLRASDILAGEIREIPKEGSLLPETYKVVRGTPRTDVIKKMQDDHKRTVDQAWARRAPDLPLRSPYELVTLASIVEKETGKAEERPHVASVFVNRLQKRMRLQSDPTIVYGLVGGKGTLGRGITRSELDKPTAYNTYTIEGLPPGPIANPGRAALDAAANPSRTPDLYFVADGSGGHAFAATLDQHARNVQKWRLIEKDMREKDASDKMSDDVDRSSPQLSPPPAAPAQGGDRRGAVESVPSVYGALPSRIEAFGIRAEGQGSPPAIDAIATATRGAEETTQETTQETTTRGRRGKGRTKVPSAVSAFTMGPGLDALGLKVRGVDANSAAPATAGGLDGAIDSGDPEPELATYAVPVDRRAELKARSLRLGLPVGDDDLPGRDSTTGSPGSGLDVPVDGTLNRRIYDVSEGTKLDPLRNRTYDLNFAKEVPGRPKK
jgi:UPF0755 protein